MLTSYVEPFLQASQRLMDDSSWDSAWVCKAGLWPDAVAPMAVVLKLLKQHWSPDPRDSIASTAGIFFSVWVDEPAISRGGVHYNLHALKLRQLTNYTIEGRKFAAEFRARFASLNMDWPEVETAFGPQTLFQGFHRCPPEAVQGAVVELARLAM